ncbi:hypothetical protein ACFL2K_03670 [Candidatus Margulisiibacteriota bacterium]
MKISVKYLLWMISFVIIFGTRMFAAAISDDGTHVGIGTTQPDQNYRLTIWNGGHLTSHVANFVSNSTEATYLALGNTNAPTPWYLATHSDGRFIVHQPGVGDRFAIRSDGAVGIGTGHPDSNFKLSVWNGGNVPGFIANFQSDAPVSYVGIQNSNASNGWLLSCNSEGVFALHQPGVGDRITVLNNGNIGIGAGSPQYKLTVNGCVYATSIKVRETIAVNSLILKPKHWADYVFSDSYQKMPLENLESFIKKNKHLPGIPKAEEAVNKGVSVGEMQAKLLEKVEELTLYVIELKKENELQKQKIQGLENRMGSGQVVFVN